MTSNTSNPPITFWTDDGASVIACEEFICALAKAEAPPDDVADDEDLPEGAKLANEGVWETFLEEELRQDVEAAMTGGALRPCYSNGRFDNITHSQRHPLDPFVNLYFRHEAFIAFAKAEWNIQTVAGDGEPHRPELHGIGGNASLVAATSVTHYSTRQRTNILDPEIDKAIKQAGSTDAHEVFVVMRDRALMEKGPFLGVNNEKGALLYTDANGKSKELNRDALDKRLKRRQPLIVDGNVR